MSEGFDKFLRENTPRGPGRPLAEKQRIWRAIENGKRPQPHFDWWITLAPAVCAMAALMLTKYPLKNPRDAEIDRILAVSVSYDLVEDETGFP